MKGTTLAFEGKIDQLKGKIRSKWGQVTDDDIERAKGDAQQLVGIIKEKTGKTSQEIERELNRMAENR